jgi:uncharacterized membrane protein
MTKARLEAFSDGVFAIAITLLVLDLRVPPELAEGRLWAALGAQWPSYVAYLVTFLVIGIMWVNHHGIFERARAVDRPVLFANLALLLLVSFLPFPTRLVSEFLTRGEDAHAALAVYSGTMLLVGWAFSALWLILTRDTGGEGLLHASLDRAAHRAAIRRFGLGSVAYGATVALSFVTPIGTLALHAALALYYCFDQLRPGGAAQGAEAGG